MAFRVNQTITKSLDRFSKYSQPNQVAIDIMPFAVATIQENIRTQGQSLGEKWKELSLMTVVNRRGFRPGGKLPQKLRDTGLLMNSINSNTKIINVKSISATIQLVASRRSDAGGYDIAKALHEGIPEGNTEGSTTPVNTSKIDAATIKRLKEAFKELKGKKPDRMPARPYMDFASKQQNRLLQMIQKSISLGLR